MFSWAAGQNIETRQIYLRCLHRVLRARADDASFSNVRALADASSCKAANKSTI